MKNESAQEMPCPCGTGNVYRVCCEPFHRGESPDNALKLMRSRYSAYALSLPAYIISTTHPASPYFCHDAIQWTNKISERYSHMEFKKLQILDFQEQDRFSTVTFVAHLAQDKRDLSFTERSYFEKIKEKWLYRCGKLSEGFAPNLIAPNPFRLMPLAYYGNPILRNIAKPIPHINENIHKIVEEMVETLDAYNEIGFAAPQIHHSLKIFVIRTPHEIKGGDIELKDIKIFINPELSMPSTKTWKASESCLSIPSIHVEVERPREVTVDYYTLEGNKIKERVVGWEARAIMHENDHINGALFIDRLDEMERKNLEPLLTSLYNRIHDGIK
jgi:peptide deformylase